MPIDKDRESSQSPFVRVYFGLVDASGMTDEAFSDRAEAAYGKLLEVAELNRSIEADQAQDRRIAREQSRS